MNVERSWHQKVFIYPWNDDLSDEYGNPRPDWDMDNPVVYERGLIQPINPAETREVTGDRETIVSEYLLQLPAGAEVGGRDRAGDEEGHIYEVVGQPGEARTTRGEVTHVEGRLRLVDL